MGFSDFDMAPETIDVEGAEAKVKFERYIELSRSEVSNICRLIEPLTKSALDEYGKSVFFTCVGDAVEVRYFNNPYVVVGTVANGGTVVKDFAIMVSTLRNFLGSGLPTLVFVEQDGDMHFAFGDQLIFMETKALRKEAYDFDYKSADKPIDSVKAQYVFKKVGVVLNQTERASEKVIIVKDGHCIFNTGVLAAKLDSPFGKDCDDMVIFKQVADGLAALSEFGKNLKYDINGRLVVTADNVYIEYPVGVGERVNQFISPSVNLALQFGADVAVETESLYRLVRLVQSLDYLSKSVKVGFAGNTMNFQLTTESVGRTFPYSFKILSGKPETMGEMNITVDVLKVFLDIVGDDVRFNFNTNGLGIINDNGTFLIRKS